jgi:hypothetical protein
MSRIKLTCFVASTLTFGCSSTNESETSAELSGTAVYRDSTTDHSGATQPAATPPPQSARITVVVKGTGQIPELDPKCALDPAGQFEAHYLSTMSVSDGNVYSSSFAEGSGQIQTPSGCEIPNLTVGLITDVVVRGELTINTTNCETFCQAEARADAEAQCGTSASSATCRAQYEAQASGQCQTTCTTKAHAIVAEVSLAASLLGDLDAEALRAAALGELTANLTFDHLEDADGKDL